MRSLKIRLVRPTIRVMSVKKAEVDISDVSDCEWCYLAALIDGEGAIEIHKRDLYPMIRVGMRSLLPFKLCKRHGGVINKRYRRNAPFYTCNIYKGSLLRPIVEKVVEHSEIKKRQLKLVLKAIRIRDEKSLGWKEKMMQIKEEISRLNKQPPPDIDLESGEEENSE